MKSRILVAILLIITFNAKAQQSSQDLYDQSVVYHKVNPQISGSSQKRELESLLKKRRQAIKEFQEATHKKNYASTAMLIRGTKKNQVGPFKTPEISSGRPNRIGRGRLQPVA